MAHLLATKCFIDIERHPPTKYFDLNDVFLQNSTEKNTERICIDSKDEYLHKCDGICEKVLFGGKPMVGPDQTPRVNTRVV